MNYSAQTQRFKVFPHMMMYMYIPRFSPAYFNKSIGAVIKGMETNFLLFHLSRLVSTGVEMIQTFHLTHSTGNFFSNCLSHGLHEHH